MVTVGSIVNGGFRLLRERPLSVLIWGAVYMAFGVGGSLLLMRPLMAAAQAGGTTPGAAPAAGMVGVFLTFYLGYLLLAIVLYAAAIRAALRPEEDSFASMRVGMDELRLLGVVLLLMLISFVTLIAGSIVAGIAAAMFAISTRGSGGGSAFIVVFVSIIAVYCLAIFVQVRLSPAIPLTIMRRQIVISEAWTLSKGRFWTLFGGYFILALIMLIAFLVVAGFTMGPYIAALGQHGFTPEGLQAASQSQLQQQLDGISPMTVIGWILGGLIGGVGFAVWGGALAAVADGLVGTTNIDYAETFA